MLNFKTRNLLLLICIVKSTTLFGAEPRPAAARTLSEEKMSVIAALGLSAGIALGTGNLKSGTVITASTGLIISKSVHNSDDRKTCAALFGASTVLGVIYGVFYTHRANWKRPK